MGTQLGGGAAGGFATDWVVAGLFLIKKSKSKSLSLAWSCVVWPQRGAGMRWVMPRHHPDTQNHPARSRLVVFWVVLAAQKPPRPAPAWSTRRAQLRPAPASSGLIWVVFGPPSDHPDCQLRPGLARAARAAWPCLYVDTNNPDHPARSWCTHLVDQVAARCTWSKGICAAWSRVYGPSMSAGVCEYVGGEYASMWLSM